MDITPDYRCAITQMIFKNPVKCKTNIDDKHPITYENYAIKKWLRGNKLCPLKKQEITIIEDDLEMKMNIEKLIKNNPELVDEQFVECDDSINKPLNILRSACRRQDYEGWILVAEVIRGICIQ